MSTPALGTANEPAQAAQLEREFAQRIVALTGGAQVAVRECGPADAAPVVLLHGISSGAASWLQVAFQLKTNARVIAWDAPGYGDSTPLPQEVPVADDYARRLLELLAALGVEHCVLCGHSLGALMAGAAARLDAQGRIARVVLVSPATGYGSASQAQARERVRSERSEALASQGVEGIAARIDQRLLSPNAGDDARAWARWNAARLHPAGYLQAVQMLCDSELGKPVQPVQVHAGALDVVTPPEKCEAWAKANGVPFHLIEGAGHASPIEQPGRVAALLEESLHG